ncbi:MAG: DNA/RNA non-specific endonuclease [Acidobacteriota bacterium]
MSRHAKAIRRSSRGPTTVRPGRTSVPTSRPTSAPLSLERASRLGHRVEDLPSLQRQPHDTYADGPPGAAKGTFWDTDETTEHNDEDVPEEVIAVMKEPNDGGTPSVDPPGWDFLKTKYGKLKGSWVRFHIINAKLGGPGNDTTNLVPTTVALNHNAGWRTLEDAAKDSASEDEDWTYVDVDISYDDDFPAGIPQRIDASWGYWDGDDWSEEGTAGPLIQVNPDDGNNNNYLPASQITQQRLRTFGLSQAQAGVAKDLIDGTFDDQDDFETALAGNSMTYDDVTDDIMGGRWFDVAGRFYVDEDPDIGGPYPVVVRNT